MIPRYHGLACGSANAGSGRSGLAEIAEPEGRLNGKKVWEFPKLRGSRARELPCWLERQDLKRVHGLVTHLSAGLSA